MAYQRLLDFGFENIDLWRSEQMELVSIMLPTESAHETVHALGDIGLLQFKDLNVDKSAFQRTYASQVKRCEEMARRLRFFHEQVAQAKLLVHAKVHGVVAPQEKSGNFDELEGKLEELEKELVQTNSNMERLQRSHAELVEMQLVLETAGNFFDSRATAKLASAVDEFGEFQDGNSPLLEAQQAAADKVARVGFVAGTVVKEKVLAFERLLFRATRGNMLLKQQDVGLIKDPESGENLSKVVFCVFFAGERAQNKIHKICEVFGANKYPFPEDIARQRQMATEVAGRLRELQATNEAGERRREVVLKEIAFSLDDWTIMVRKEKAVYHTLNKLSMDVTSKVLIAEAWVPSFARQQVQDALTRTGQASHTQLQPVMQSLSAHDSPPTHFRTNKFTSCFQAIVEAYGVARYREVNPTVLTLMTFPFLFAVMFGDVGHAILMILFAGFLIIKEKQLAAIDLGDMVTLLFGGRYCILCMGLYSVYTGLIYNEFFSIPMAIFGGTQFRCWQPRMGESSSAAKYPGYAPSSFDVRNCQTWGGEILWPGRGEHMLPETHVYVMGMDPIWHGRRTELSYFNSVKMKMSIIMGVTHMDFGILNSLYNNLYWKDYVSVFWEFIPQFIFLNALFGYLSILIIVKWVTTGETEQYADLYKVMINMFLKPGFVDESSQVFSGQGGLQVFLLLLALFCVPAMMFPKPLILKSRHEAAKRKAGLVELSGATFSHQDAAPSAPAAHGGGHGHDDHGEFEFGDVMVHQMIHTIETVLGAVSNTASYLRLWALSLAHSQLSSVFFDRVLMAAIAANSIGGMLIGFFVFACATLGVLMVMESLSAFLHALRLHWVEYQGKFYKGDGYKFTPFSFEAIKAEDEEDK